MKKHRDIKLVTTERRRNYLASKRNYHTTKLFTQNVLAIEMKKKRILKFEFWYDYVKPKYGQKTKLCYMDTCRFMVYIRTWHL